MKPILASFTRPSLATTLLLAASAHFNAEAEAGAGVLVGREEDRWDPQTIWMELHDDTDGQILKDNFEKLMVAVEVITSNGFSQSLSDFQRICNELSDSPTDGGYDPAELHEIAWGLVEAHILSGEGAELTPEIFGYIQVMMSSSGMSSMPKTLASMIGHSVVSPRFTQTDDIALFEMVQGAADRKADEVDVFVRERLKRLDAEVSRTGLRQPGWLTEVLSKMADESGNQHSEV